MASRDHHARSAAKPQVKPFRRQLSRLATIYLAGLYVADIFLWSAR
jgi:hypothetical protein